MCSVEVRRRLRASYGIKPRPLAYGAKVNVNTAALRALFDNNGMSIAQALRDAGLCSAQWQAIKRRGRCTETVADKLAGALMCHPADFCDWYA